MRIPLIRLHLLILILLSASLAKASAYNAVVYLKEKGSVQGVLLSIRPEIVKLDPDGPVSLRTFSSDEIDSVFIGGLDTTFYYPLEQDQIPSELEKYSQKTMFGRTKRKEIFTLSMTGGFASVGLDYYEGYTSGLSIEAEARCTFIGSSVRHSEFFIAFALRHSSAGVESWLERTLIYYDSQGNPVHLVFQPLTVNHYAFRFGRSWYSSNSISNIYLVCGLSVLSNTAKARLEIDRSGEMEVIERLSISESKFAGGIGFGAIAPISSNIGIKMSAGYEIFVTGKEEKGGYEVMTGGGTLLLDIGLSLEL